MLFHGKKERVHAPRVVDKTDSLHIYSARCALCVAASRGSVACAAGLPPGNIGTLHLETHTNTPLPTPRPMRRDLPGSAQLIGSSGECRPAGAGGLVVAFSFRWSLSMPVLRRPAASGRRQGFAAAGSFILAL